MTTSDPASASPSWRRPARSRRRCVWMLTLRSSCSAGCARRISLSRVRYGASVRPSVSGRVPVADPDLVLLGVEVLLAARLDRDVLEQLVAGVHAPRRRARRGDHGTDLERRRAAVLEVGVQDVGGVDEEVRPHRVVGLRGHLAEVLLELPLGGAPGEVGVALVEADGAERVHHRRPGEGLGEEEHVGVGAADLLEQPLPERDRLGVRVVDPEDPDAVRHPVLDDAQHLAADPDRVVVEVDRVDVLVLLRRVLGVGDRAVGAGGEELRVRLDPRVVRGHLQGEVEGDLEAEPVGAGHERVEVLEGAEVGVHGVVAAVLRADRPRRPGVGRARGRGCCCGPCG